MTEIQFQNDTTEFVYSWLMQEDKRRTQLQVLARNAAGDVELLGREIQNLIADFENPLSGQNSLYANLLQQCFDSVDWQHIAATLIESRS